MTITAQIRPDLHSGCSAAILEPVSPQPWRALAFAALRNGRVLPMAYTLGTAAKATGRNKTTILRAIKDGKISALRDTASGAWRIEPVELHRVYPAVVGATPDATEHNPDAMMELRARLADALDQITDLRRRLDVTTGQLGDALQQVRALTDQRAAPAKVGWWWWLRR